MIYKIQDAKLFVGCLVGPDRLILESKLLFKFQTSVTVIYFNDVQYFTLHL